MSKRKGAARHSAKHLLPVRVARAHLKLFVAIAAGIAFGLAMLAAPIGATARVLAGWDVGLLVYLALAARFRRRNDVNDIRKRAAEQDEGGFIILLLSIVATFASLIAIVFAQTGADEGEPLAVGLTILTIVLSWTFVHTIFSFHYAHEYYGEGRDGVYGGLEFPGDNRPDYDDFLYFSLVIGMTSQTSDVQIKSKVIRRMASMHGALSFFFNLVVLALTVNTVAGLVK